MALDIIEQAYRANEIYMAGQMVFLHPDKEILRQCLQAMRELAETQLCIEFNEKTHIFPMANGVDYLGWHFYLTDTGKVVKRLRTQGKKRFKRRMKGLQKGYAEGSLTIKDINRSMAATNGHLCHGHTWRLREKIANQTVYIRNEEERI